MPSRDKTQLPGHATSKDITALLAAGALTITHAEVYKFGRDVVVQLTYSDASVGYLKLGGDGRFLVGGSGNTMATGTEIVWQS